MLNNLNTKITFSFNLDEKENIPLNPLFSGTLNRDNDNFIIEYQQNEFPEYQNMFRKNFELYGQTIDGKKFVASDCFFLQTNPGTMSQNSLLITSYSIFINKLFIGDWDLDIKSKTIKNLSVRFSYIEHWFQLLKVKYNRNEKKISAISIENLDFEFKKFNINNEFTTFRIDTSFNTNIEANKKFTFDSQKWINLSFNNDIRIEEAYQKILILINFFRIILPRKNIFVEDLSITTGDDKKYEVLFKQTNYNNEELEVGCHDFLYLYNEANIQEILSNWFNIQKQYGMIMDSLFSLLDKKPFIYEENKFLAYMQWIEGFARIRYPTKEDNILEHKTNIDNIINEITTEEYKKYIRDITQFKYETPLRKQLKNIINDFEIKTLLDINAKQIQALINKLHDYRNKLTHLNDKRKYKISDLVYLNKILETILYIIFHQMLLLDQNTIAYNKLIGNLKLYYQQYKQKAFPD